MMMESSNVHGGGMERMIMVMTIMMIKERISDKSE